MISQWVLIIYLYSGTIIHDSTSIITIPMATKEACEIAGEQSKALIAKSFKKLNFVCIKTNYN